LSPGGATIFGSGWIPLTAVAKEKTENRKVMDNGKEGIL
jgi:hypothetical protein